MTASSVASRKYPIDSSEESSLQELKRKIAENKAAEEAISKEPKNVILKSYFQGTPNDLNNFSNSVFNSLKIKQTSTTQKLYALTMMVEEIEEPKKR